jgi:hypothetical protein
LVPAAALAFDNVAVALPDASVVPVTTATAPPAELLNVTAAPETPALFASSAVAVMLDVVLPSAAIVEGLAATDTFETVVPPVDPPVVGVPMMVLEPPPQAVIITDAVIQAMIDNLRMS